MKDFKQISVTAGNIVKVNNPTSYPLIGKGSQGAVFRLTGKSCVKIYAKEETAHMEITAYTLAKDSTIIPKLYEAGHNYIIIEYLRCLTLEEYLKTKGTITEALTQKILDLLNEIKRLGFPRIDWPLRHIFITKDAELKIIDLVHAFKIKKRRPTQLFKDLSKLNLLNQFAEYVQKINPEIFMEWKDAIDRYAPSVQVIGNR